MPTADRPRRRADAERSIARIVTAARACLSSDPNAGLDDIAKAAGVGRMTLYGHFGNRAALVEAALADALRAGEEALAAVDLTGDARQALMRLLHSSWSLVAESAVLLAAAREALPAERILELHAAPAQRVEDLIRRGQDQGVFRTDLPMAWLVSVVHYVLKGAAEENRAQRLGTEDAAGIVTATALSILAPPPPDPQRPR
ncbi:TetR/AcrR family transcriptional regulator [Actinocorallia populi]|uniref:TetR/AcrR family transcriptional regulator n=1 Tax=Actinocorallia populi TaxID=2079200 RepID=UPI000D08B7F3|nr:TetR/AcrR family transcriptional regulator [Actinocorallia populi]